MEILEDKDIEELKNKLKTLEEEKKTKEENLSKYEKMFENVIESVNMQDEVRTDVLKRLNDQITNYKSQIDKLLESKDNMQAYYIEAVKKMKEKIELLTTENNELKNENQNIAQNKANQKDIIDSCNQEYLQFKEAFYSMSDIENMISEFNKSSEEIKNLRDNLLSDELLKKYGIYNTVFIKNQPLTVAYTSLLYEFFINSVCNILRISSEQFENLILSYVDSDEDNIILQSEEDYNLFFQQVSQNQVNNFRISIKENCDLYLVSPLLLESIF